MKFSGRGGAIAALLIAVTSAQAGAAVNDCWSAQEASAAKLRDLQTMLMVAALRCHGSGVNVLADYNKFVAANRTAIVQANTSLKQHFSRAYGPIEGQRSYDRFTTSLANIYGAGGGGSESCADMAELAREGGSAQGSGAALLALAEQRGLSPTLPSRQCPAVLAAK